MSGLVIIHSGLKSNVLCFDQCFNFRELLFDTVGSLAEDFFITCDGKLLSTDAVLQKGHVYHVVPRILGGKGGFGSMLRAIGAQIEKTTSREACRDLSGRRMRDVNNEKKLKEWISKQADREQEKEEKRKERLAKRRAPVQHHFNDPTYAEQRGKLLDNLDDALQKGLAKAQSKAGPSATVTSEERKRKACPETAVKAKKGREWLGLDPDILNSTESDEDSSSSPSEDNSTHDNQNLETEIRINSTENSTDENSRESETGGDISQQSKTVCNPQTPETVTECLGVGKTKTETVSVASTSPAPSVRLGASYDCKVETATQPESQIIKSENVIENDSTTALKVKTEKDENSVPVRAMSPVKNADQQVKPETTTVKFEPVDLTLFDSSSELETLGLDHLKADLMRHGLKCGGTLQQRAERLFSVKGLELDQIDPSLFSKPQKKKGKKNK